MIRRFQNRDVPDLTRIWNAHHGLADIGAVEILCFELAFLARQRFDAEGLRIFEDSEGSIAGWSHSFVIESYGRVLTTCVSLPDKDPNGDVVVKLLEDQLSLFSDIQKIGIARDLDYGLAGLPPNGWCIGFTDKDPRTFPKIQQTLVKHEASKSNESPADASGWETKRWLRLSVSRSQYRVPFDRNYLEWKRNHQVAVAPPEPKVALSRFMAAALSHLDRIPLVAFDRQRRIRSVAVVLASDTEAAVMPINTALIMPMKIGGSEEDWSEPICFLLASWLASEFEPMLQNIEVVIGGQDEGAKQRLEKIGFCVQEQGCSWVKPIAPLSAIARTP